MEYAGEFFGIMILALFGTGANCQVNLSANTNVSATPAGVALGVWVTGGHINPALTLAFAVWRGFPWRKVPGYIVAQLLGGLVGGGIVYGIYIHEIDIVEGGRRIRTSKTARLFGFIPADYLSNVSCFFSEFICTALLMVGVLALTDKRNQLTPGLVPIGLFIVFVGIVSSFGMQTGFAVNPASDLGPRIFTSMVGYGTQVYTIRHQYWVWGPVMATITGAQVGTMLYDVFLFSGDESIVNHL
ncbi:hypothetical protein M413DRAFT_17714 [Hebeloma cylindrosporum]|uniref:Aquaporin n=1 Tax=Hebeloma cylindrosporum TaxID=76867 RepID=A0A0C3CKW0_HEBCY|nr:hypothetical protein M413DRAFT_17714 [Hebeloma cylindrosporum h7]